MNFKIFLFLLFSSGMLLSQTSGDSLVKKETKLNQSARMNDAMKSDGEFHGKKEQLRRNKDVFIDKDGDGICDTRQSGMSFGKMRRRMGEGKTGPGGGGRNGGPGSGYGGGSEGNFGNGYGGPEMSGSGSGYRGGR